LERKIYLEQTPLDEVFKRELPSDKPAERFLERIRQGKEKIVTVQRVKKGKSLKFINHKSK
jgi:hypothetical protein